MNLDNKKIGMVVAVALLLGQGCDIQNQENPSEKRFRTIAGDGQELLMELSDSFAQLDLIGEEVEPTGSMLIEESGNMLVIQTAVDGVADDLRFIIPKSAALPSATQTVEAMQVAVDQTRSQSQSEATEVEEDGRGEMGPSLSMPSLSGKQLTLILAYLASENFQDILGGCVVEGRVSPDASNQGCLVRAAFVSPSQSVGGASELNRHLGLIASMSTLADNMDILVDEEGTPPCSNGIGCDE